MDFTIGYKLHKWDTEQLLIVVARTASEARGKAREWLTRHYGANPVFSLDRLEIRELGNA